MVLVCVLIPGKVFVKFAKHVSDLDEDNNPPLLYLLLITALD